MLLNSYVFTGENKADLEGVKIQAGALRYGKSIKRVHVWFVVIINNNHSTVNVWHCSIVVLAGQRVYSRLCEEA